MTGQLTSLESGAVTYNILSSNVSLFIDPFTPGNNNNNNNNVDCSISQFSCELGGCVDASQECDGVSQCSNINFGDISDEENCGM